MGNCVGADSTRDPNKARINKNPNKKLPKITINKQIDLIIPAQPPQPEKNENDHEQVYMLTPLPNPFESKKDKKQSTASQKGESVNESDPLTEIKNKQIVKKNSIKPTVSVLVFDEVPVKYDSQARMSPVRQSHVKALFPNGVEEPLFYPENNKKQSNNMLQSQVISLNRSKKQKIQSNNILQSQVKPVYSNNNVKKQPNNVLQSQVKPLRVDRNSFEKAVNVDDFKNSKPNPIIRRSENKQELPQQLPSTSIQKKWKIPDKKFQPKELSVIESQNQMLQSQTVTLIGSRAGIGAYPPAEKQTRRRPTLDSIPDEVHQENRRSTL